MAKKKSVAKKTVKSKKTPATAPKKKAAAPRVSGLGGLFFRAKSPAKTRAWYAKHLGLPVDEQGNVLFQWREAEGRAKGMTVWAAFDRDTKYFGKSGQEFMINYRVKDLDAVVAALEAEGVKVAPEREEAPYGRFAWITDLDGRRVELWEPPKGH